MGEVAAARRAGDWGLRTRRRCRRDAEWVLGVLEPLGEHDHYRSYDFPAQNKVKIYLDEGSVFVDLKSGKGVFESVT